MMKRIQILTLVSLAFVIFGCQTSPFKVNIHKLKDPELAQLSQDFLYHYYLSLDERNLRSMEIKDCEKLRTQSSELLVLNEKFKEDWNYGNVILTANLFLGTCEVWEGHDSKALAYLKAASASRGSPQLNSFGPDRRHFKLVTELLKKGYQKEVLAYLESIERYWSPQFSDEKVTLWKSEIRLGQIPDFLK